MKKWIVQWAFLAVFILAFAGPAAERTPMDLIHEVLQNSNASVFSTRGLKIDFLKNCPQVIPTLAQWMFDEWSPYDASLTKEKLIDSFKERLHDDCLPITIVALRNEMPVGIVSLKERSGPDFSDFPEHSLWGGSLLVAPEEKNQGLGEALGKVALAIGRCLNYKDIYFYTSNPENIHWYTKRGAQIIETRPFHGHTITIFRMAIEQEK